MTDAQIRKLGVLCTAMLFQAKEDDLDPCGQPFTIELYDDVFVRLHACDADGGDYEIQCRIMPDGAVREDVTVRSWDDHRRGMSDWTSWSRRDNARFPHLVSV